MAKSIELELNYGQQQQQNGYSLENNRQDVLLDHVYDSMMDGIVQMQRDLTVLPVADSYPKDDIFYRNGRIANRQLPAMNPLAHGHFVNYAGEYIAM